MLLRTIQHVLDRTPSALLHEIILVDRGSTLPALGPSLDGKVALLSSRIHIVRMSSTSIVKARNSGAKTATGEALVFLER